MVDGVCIGVWGIGFCDCVMVCEVWVLVVYC